MITSSEEALRHEGGPIEKTHLKDMVQRNALESLVFSKITKHIETEKKAFTRQNSRDETEMKHLLLRLHHHQQTTLLGDDISSESEDEDDLFSETKESDKSANPYPVTIIPKFGALPSKSTSKQDSTKLTNESLKHFGDNEELSSHLQLSHPSTSSIITPGSNTPRYRDQRSEWLGDPEAILSVRRPRKPGLDQIHTARRSSSEQNVLGDFSSISSGSVMLTPRDRSNSFCSTKERKLQSSEGDECHIPNRRGGSLKERPTTNTEHGKYGTRPLVRSYSMLTKTSLQELQNRCGALGTGRSGSQEIKKMTACREDSDSISNRNWRKTKHGSLKEKNRTSFQRNDTEPIIKQSLSRKSSADGEPIIKQSLSRKSSADGEPIIKQSLSRKSSADGEPIIKQSLSRKSSADGEPIIKQSLSRKSSTAGEQQGSKGANSPKNLSRKPSKEMKKKMEKSENNQPGQDVIRHHTVTYIYGDSANTSYDENSPRKSLSPNSKQSYRPKGLSANTSPDNSPRMSSLARDQPVFKY